MTLSQTLKEMRIEREKKNFFKAGYTLGSKNIHVPFEDPDKYPG